MLESSFLSSPNSAPVIPGTTARTVSRPHPVFRMMLSDDDRINGSIPVWDDKAAESERVAGGLADAAQARSGDSMAGDTAYANTAATESKSSEPFGFADLVDMVNPLQHIPLVGNLYRFVTGDEIKPVSRVVGGAMFGGPLAAAAALVNVAVHQETGKDIAGNLIALAMNETPVDASMVIAQGDRNPSVPDTAISFADLGQSRIPAAVSAPLPQILPPPLKLASFSPFETY